MTDVQLDMLEVDGHRLRVGTAGEGPPILLVPGITMSIDRWVDAGYVGGLASDRRVIVVDPLGHGGSDLSENIDDYRMQSVVRRMVAVLDALGVDRADVWGYSRGAGIGGSMAHTHTDRVRSLVYGGNVLFDARAVMKALDMLPDPADVAAAHDRAMGGDWSAYWELFPVPLPEATKRDIEGRNHLPSIAAAAQAGREDNVVWSRPSETPVFAYWGSEEIFSQMNSDCAGDERLTHAVIRGDHASAFAPAQSALDEVVPFLESVDRSST